MKWFFCFLISWFSYAAPRPEPPSGHQVQQNIGAGEQARNAAQEQDKQSQFANGLSSFTGSIAAGCFATQPVPNLPCAIPASLASIALLAKAALFSKAAKKNRNTAYKWENKPPPTGDDKNPYRPQNLPPPGGGPPSNEPTPDFYTDDFTGDGEGETVQFSGDPENQLRKWEKKLRDRGLAYNREKNSITMPDGTVYSGKDFLSSPHIPEKYKNRFKQQAKKLKSHLDRHYARLNAQNKSNNASALKKGQGKKSLYSQGGGGYKGYGRAKTKEDLNSFMSSPQRNPASREKKGSHLDRASGLSVRYGKDRIGISEDNIFALVHRQYQLQRQKKLFLKND